jgi:hypothetical protein
MIQACGTLSGLPLWRCGSPRCPPQTAMSTVSPRFYLVGAAGEAASPRTRTTASRCDRPSVSATCRSRRASADSSVPRGPRGPRLARSPAPAAGRPSLHHRQAGRLRGGGALRASDTCGWCRTVACPSSGPKPRPSCALPWFSSAAHGKPLEASSVAPLIKRAPAGPARPSRAARHAPLRAG